MGNSINLYGDQRVATASGHGIDIATQRADDLDLMAIEYIRTRAIPPQQVIALDVGCGFGGQAARMAKVGAQVLAMDIENYEAQVTESMRREGVGEGFSFAQASVVDELEIGGFDVIVCQRMIHYLEHSAAKQALAWLHRIAKDTATLFISASGLDSELGQGYDAALTPVHSRFAPLSPSMAEKHSIHPPVCLYRQEELEGLVTRAGWEVEKAYLSPFGNVKVVARKGAAVPLTNFK